MKKIGTQTIETERLILRRFTVEDAGDMYRNWASDPEVTKYLTWPPHESEEFTKSLLADWVEMYEKGEVFHWAIVLKDSGEVIGDISVVRLDEEVEAAEIGYCMTRRLWGKGIMPEALKAVEDYLFDRAEFNRVAACHDPENAKSGRVMQKAGMQYEGTRRKAIKSNQGVTDVAMHAIIKTDRKQSK